MRNVVLLIAIHALPACSVDHIVVAALDDAGSAGEAGANKAGAGPDSAGATSDSAGAADLAGNAGANDSASGAPSLGTGGARSLGAGGNPGVLLTSSGGDVGALIGGDAGATSKFICSCLGNQGQLCGTDGVTYSSSDTCDDGGACQPPSIACWHACPCNPGESPDMNATTTWFSPECAGAVQCSGDFTCMAFSGDVKITCGNTTGN